MAPRRVWLPRKLAWPFRAREDPRRIFVSVTPWVPVCGTEGSVEALQPARSQSRQQRPTKPPDRNRSHVLRAAEKNRLSHTGELSAVAGRHAPQSGRCFVPVKFGRLPKRGQGENRRGCKKIHFGRIRQIGTRFWVGRVYEDRAGVSSFL